MNEALAYDAKGVLGEIGVIDNFSRPSLKM